MDNGKETLEIWEDLKAKNELSFDFSFEDIEAYLAVFDPLTTDIKKETLKALYLNIVEIYRVRQMANKGAFKRTKVDKYIKNEFAKYKKHIFEANNTIYKLREAKVIDDSIMSGDELNTTMENLSKIWLELNYFTNKVYKPTLTTLKNDLDTNRKNHNLNALDMKQLKEAITKLLNKKIHTLNKF